jgi:hypothetical protein
VLTTITKSVEIQWADTLVHNNMDLYRMLDVYKVMFIAQRTVSTEHQVLRSPAPV